MAKSDNVQRLLQAEERRNKIVTDAKARKHAKVKQAKVDAEHDVSDFRKEKDHDCEQHKNTLLSGATMQNSNVVKDTDKQIAEMKTLSNQRMEKVASMMVGLITAVSL